MRVFSILVFLLLFVLQGLAQPKYEREIRIRERAVPAIARSFVDSMNFNRRIRWYKEIGFDRISFEAKTRFKGQRYSIEFSEDGTFEDVEIEIDSTDIPDLVLSRITSYLQGEHTSFSIRKVQIQYSGNRNHVLSYFREKKPSDDIIIHYELVVATRMEGAFVMFEYLFTSEGEFVNRSRIVLSNTNNIEF